MSNKLLGTPNTVYTVRDGTTYTADAHGVVTVSDPRGHDLVDLLNAGLVPVGNHLPAVSGRFIGLPVGATPVAVLTVSGTLYAYPVFIPSTVTLASLNLSVTTGQTGGKGRCALFYDNAGYPGAIVPGTDSGDLAATATAVPAKSGLSVIIPAGWYWVVSIFAATSTMPSVIGATANYTLALNSILGSDTAAHALATSGQAATGIAKTGQTYPATDMTTSFPTFPTGAALTLNAATPIIALGV